jgi:ribonuclease HII
LSILYGNWGGDLSNGNAWVRLSWDPEKECAAEGYSILCGVDEVGVGCLAGPVVAAAVILHPDRLPVGVSDSKLLSAKKRETIAEEIRRLAVAWAIGHAEVDEIDSINIFHAAKRAMERALAKLPLTPDIVLVDGKFKIQTPLPQKCYVKGDLKSVSIGAASILAKVHRDQWMQEFDSQFPGYGFAKHKGYGSKFHRQQLQALGATPLHRKSFSWTPV